MDIILKLSAWYDKMITVLNKIQNVEVIELDAVEFAVKMKLFNFNKPEARKFRRQILRHLVIPKNLNTAADFQVWNNMLKEFGVVVEKFEENDAFGLGVFILEWWQKTLEKHPQAPNIFHKMEEIEIGSEDWKVWKNMFPRWLMLKNYPEFLLKLGDIDYLCMSGKAEYVIENFNLLKIVDYPQDVFDEDCISRYAEYAMEVETSQMERYLKQHDLEKTNIFFFHPLGLSVLVKNDCSGYIAKHAKEFEFIARNFPDTFRFSVNAEKEYVQMVNNQLELNIIIPEPFRMLNY